MISIGVCDTAHLCKLHLRSLRTRIGRWLGFFQTKDMQQFCSPECWIEWKINFPIYFFELWLVVFTIYRWHTDIFKCVSNQKKKSFKSGQICRKDAQWAQFLYSKFIEKFTNFEYKTGHISKKIKITEIRKSIFHSFEHILHLSCNYDQNFQVEKHFIHLPEIIGGGLLLDWEP